MRPTFSYCCGSKFFSCSRNSFRNSKIVVQNIPVLICLREKTQFFKFFEDNLKWLFYQQKKEMCLIYRGISLINMRYKILLERLTPYLGHQIRAYHSGFRKNQSSNNEIFTVSNKNFGSTIKHQLFIYFKEAYDRTKSVEVWNTMSEMGISKKWIKLTKTCLNGSTRAVIVGGTTSSFCPSILALIRVMLFSQNHSLQF